MSPSRLEEVEEPIHSLRLVDAMRLVHCDPWILYFGKMLTITNYRSPSTFPSASFPFLNSHWDSGGLRRGTALALSATRCMYLHSQSKPDNSVTFHVRDLTNPAYPLITALTLTDVPQQQQLECTVTWFHLFILASEKLHVYNAATCTLLHNLVLTGEVTQGRVLMQANAREDVLYMVDDDRQYRPFAGRVVDYPQWVRWQDGYWMVIGCDGNGAGNGLMGWERDVVVFVVGKCHV